MSGRIIQFGTSRFLQAHVALFLHEARQAGQDVGPITIVQASNSRANSGRLSAFGQPDGYPVILRGLEDGRPVERHIAVTSTDRGLSAVQDWAELHSLFRHEAAYVVSNMGDTGYDVPESDRDGRLLGGHVPSSFPGKLTALLHSRWLAGGMPITILPCELLNRNGQVLRDTILDLATGAHAPGAFLAWLRERVIWADTLVDRIVSEALEPAGAIAEPYALWVIEQRPGLVLPCQHPAIQLAEELEPFERLKLHILNLGHTVLADIWQHEHRLQGETVREILADPAIRARLEAVYREEVLPGFTRHGMASEAGTYVATTFDRFLNPFLNHRIADIAQNHRTKVERRIASFLDWVGTSRHATPVLDGVLARSQDKAQA
ncbi:mannitol dehydrogenase family protein [Roseomonas sp. GC11]|uniref:mannitol dehydrogenase family protein n=1 Tax=Roseomonas sp. GC11 TaxID=2950546 RepID=UPI00210E15CA|nr:mannitol dehydrogenase family protein [Roseomonas sp. GC11]MCQ4161838.1 mannitol dehydrogenase family protein [Roseomonas sp. GC11]